MMLLLKPQASGIEDFLRYLVVYLLSLFVETESYLLVVLQVQVTILASIKNKYFKSNYKAFEDVFHSRA